jgi:hypothetical protein
VERELAFSEILLSAEHEGIFKKIRPRRGGFFYMGVWQRQVVGIRGNTSAWIREVFRDSRVDSL